VSGHSHRAVLLWLGLVVTASVTHINEATLRRARLGWVGPRSWLHAKTPYPRTVTMCTTQKGDRPRLWRLGM